MAYYKIPKDIFHKFYQEYTTTNDLIPSQIIPDKDFEILQHHFLYEDSSYQSIIDQYPKSIENINNFKKNSTDFDLKKTSHNFHFDTESKIAIFLSNNKKHHHYYYLQESLTNFFAFNYLVNEKKYNNFKDIINYSILPSQSSIIDIDFGTENSIPTIPIQNTDGINQGYASFYNQNINNIIIHSTSPIQSIILSLGFTPPLASPEEVQDILNNTSNFVDVNFLANPEIFIIEDKSTLDPKNIDSFEDLQNKISDTKNPLPFPIFFELFTKNLEQYCSNENIKNSHFQFLINFEQHLLTYPIKEIEELYIPYIKKLFKTISEETSLNILKVLSPNSPFIGKNIATEMGINFHNTLNEELTCVETAYFYSNFLNQEFNKNKHFVNEELEIIDESPSIKSKKSYEKIITEGFPITTNQFNDLGPYGKKAIETLLEKVVQKDESTYKQFKESPEFTKLQRDIYPLLTLKDKLNYLNYECFVNGELEGLKYFHVTSIPFSLWNDEIFTSIIDGFNQNELIQINHGNIRDVKEKYFTPAFFNLFSDQLEQATQNKDLIYLTEFNKIFNNSDFKYLIKNCLDTHLDKEKIVKNFSQQLTMFKNDGDLKNLLEYFSSTLISQTNIKKLTENYFEAIKNIYILQPNIFENPTNHKSTELLDFLVKSPSFDTSNLKTQKLILDIYKKNNNCVSKYSGNSLVSLFQNFDFLKQIIDMHKENKTISYCKGFNISRGLKSDHFSDTFIRSSSLKEIKQLAFDVAYLSPSLLTILPDSIVHDAEKWKETISLFLTTNKKDDNLNVPSEITNNYDVFDFTLSAYLQKIKEMDQKQYKSSNIIEQTKILTQFPKLFICREEQVLKILETLSLTQFKSNSEHKTIKEALKKINIELYCAIDNIERQNNKNGTNNFEKAIIGLKDIIMSKKIFKNVDLEKNENNNYRQVKKF